MRAFPVGAALTEKQRFLVGTQKVMKVDLAEPLVLDAAEQERFAALAEEAAGDGGGCQAAIVADFAQGLFSARLLHLVCRAVRRRVGVLAGDVSGRRAGLRAMRQMDLLCPSESELREAYSAFDEGLPTLAWRLLEETRSGAAAITMGAEGLVAFDRLESAESRNAGFSTRVRGEHVPALVPYAIDPLGCGDSLITTAALAMACGASLVAGVFLGSAAAAVQAQRIGNIPVSSADLRRAVARLHSARLAYAEPEVVRARAVSGAGVA